MYNKKLFIMSYAAAIKFAQLLLRNSKTIGKVYTGAKYAAKGAGAASTAYAIGKGAKSLYGSKKKVSYKPNKKSFAAQIISQQPGSVTTSFIKTMQKKKKRSTDVKFFQKMARLGGQTIKYKRVSTQRCEQNPGLKSIYTLDPAFARADLQTLDDRLIVGAVDPVNKRWLAHSCYMTHYIRNMTSNELEMEIYDVVLKTDTTDVSVDVICQDDNLAEGGGSSDYLGISHDFNESKEFGRLFKVVGKQKLFLSAGGTHKHVMYHNPGKIINAYEYVQQAHEWRKGLTAFSIIRAIGMPVNDQTTKSSISTASQKLNVVTTREYLMYGWAETQNKTTVAGTTLPQTFAVGERWIEHDGDLGQPNPLV